MRRNSIIGFILFIILSLSLFLTGSMVTSKKYFSGQKVVYSLNLKGGKKYVGKTNNFDARMKQHFGGYGSKWTQIYKPVSINHVQVCRTSSSQARAETIVYEKMRNYHGSRKVRGAGYTKSY